MSFLPFLHFFSSLVYLYLAVFVVIKNPKSTLNRVCTALILCFTFWSFGKTFTHHPDTLKDIARLAVNISSTGWVSFSSFFLWFALIFTQKKGILKTRLFYPLLFALPLLFIYKQWTNSLIIDFVKYPYGWTGVWSKSIWPYLFYLYYLSFMGTGLYLLFDFGKKTGNPIKKRQARIIFITAFISLVIGSLTDVLFPNLKIYPIPNVADVTTLIWASGMVYAIAKYKFLIITPAMAADNIISTMTDSLILLDARGNIATVNKAALDLLGYQENELEGESAGLLFEEGVLLDKIVKGESLKNYELLIKAKDGESIPVIFSTSVLRDQIGSIAGIVCVAADLTEHKKMQAKLIRTEKLAAAGQVASETAHEIKNPLGVIKAGLYYIKMLIPKEDVKIQQTIQQMDNAVLRTTGFIDDLLDISRPLELKTSLVDINKLIKKAMDELPPATLSNIEVVQELSGDLPEILADFDRLKQVIVNLIKNAAEAMQKVERRELRVNSRKEEEFIRISISDTGRGIPEKDRSKIFDPFYTTKQKGIGLGLAICHRFVEAHQGKMEIESKPGVGTTFVLWLPLKP